jgi:hypothetical protein
MKQEGKIYTRIHEWLTKNTGADAMRHFERTAYWAKQLRPEADEALLVAALAHDAERVFHGEPTIQKGQDLKEADYLLKHQEGGAEIVENFLKTNGADAAFIDRVRGLISKHEEGGSDDQNLIKDADSVSFFENNIEYFLRSTGKYGLEVVRDKFTWMFERSTSEKARDITRPWYEQAIARLK